MEYLSQKQKPVSEQWKRAAYNSTVPIKKATKSVKLF